MAQEFTTPPAIPPTPPTPPPPTPPIPGPVQEFPAPEAPKKKNNTVWIIVAVVVVLLCCCCLVAAGIYLYNNGDQIFDLSQAPFSLAYLLS